MKRSSNDGHHLKMTKITASEISAHKYGIYYLCGITLDIICVDTLQIKPILYFYYINNIFPLSTTRDPKGSYLE